MYERTAPPHPSRTRRGHVAATLLGAACWMWIGCAGMSYPPEPDPAAEAARTKERPEEHAAVVAQEFEASNRSWADLARAGRDATKIGDLAAAEQAYLEAVSLTDGYDATDVRTRTSLNNLVRTGGLYQQRGLMEDAGRVVDRVVAEALSGRFPDFDSAAPVLRTQAAYYDTAGRSADAEAVYTAALAMAPSAQRRTAEGLFLERRLALAQLSTGETDAAAPVLESLLARARATAAADPAGLAAALVDAGRLRAAQGNFGAAQDAYLEAISLYRTLDAETLRRAEALNYLASLYVAHDRADAALTFVDEALGLLDAQGLEGALRAACLDTQASAEAQLGRDALAEQHYIEALTQRDKAAPGTRRALSVILEHYAELLERQGRTAEAADVRARLQVESRSPVMPSGPAF